MDSSKTERFSYHIINFTGDRGNDNLLLTLTGSAMIDTSIIAAAAFKLALSQAKPLIIDLTAITEVDTSFIQLLLALGKSVKAQDCEVSLSLLDDTHALKRAARITGMLTPAAGSWFNLRYPYTGGV